MSCFRRTVECLHAHDNPPRRSCAPGKGDCAGQPGGKTFDGGHGERGGGPASVTIAYIAESAGVSVPTVSKVLNGRSGVSDETRARVGRPALGSRTGPTGGEGHPVRRLRPDRRVA
ncbi:LacI family DNA-binding transcriptional regulator [Streptomyces sp. 4N124]|uniref:LacI family DNA-binding transcriptional regulator n=1 Tax=Streptomyces sp. 4N124 TaxID=3457420 RepID=UPI003FD3E22F